MSIHNAIWMRAWLASALIAVAIAVPATHADETGSTDDSSGFASITIEGASEDARYHVDDRALSIPIRAGRPFVIKSGHHVIEVYEGERLALREEISLKPGAAQTLRVPKAE